LWSWLPELRRLLLGGSGVVEVCETCSTRGCHRPATWEIECRGAGVASCLIYSCDDHCPDPAIISPQDEIRRLVEKE